MKILTHMGPFQYCIVQGVHDAIHKGMKTSDLGSVTTIRKTIQNSHAN